MRVHRNAKTTLATRQLLIQRVLHDGWTLSEASAAMGVSRQTGHKWVRRYRASGPAALEDRSSVPHSSSRNLPIIGLLLAEAQKAWSSLLMVAWGITRCLLLSAPVVPLRPPTKVASRCRLWSNRLLDQNSSQRHGGSHRRLNRRECCRAPCRESRHDGIEAAPTWQGLAHSGR